MEDSMIKTLRTLGISMGLILIILIIALAFYAYGKVLETQLNRLLIRQAKRELGIDDTPDNLRERIESDIRLRATQNNNSRNRTQ